MVDRRIQILLARLRQQGIRDERLLQIMEVVPRERFIDEAFEHKAHDNTALPIGLGQTISQPYIVARMTELLVLQPESRVLEIGTGSGYQTAILAYLVKHVYSVERIKNFNGKLSVGWNCLICIIFLLVTLTVGKVGHRVGYLMPS